MIRLFRALQDDRLLVGVKLLLIGFCLLAAAALEVLP